MVDNIHSLSLLLGQNLCFPLFLLEMGLSVVLHEIVEVHELASSDVSRGVLLDCPVHFTWSAWSAYGRGRLEQGGIYSGKATLTSRVLGPAFSKRLRSKPACLAARA